MNANSAMLLTGFILNGLNKGNSFQKRSSYLSVCLEINTIFVDLIKTTCKNSISYSYFPS